MIKNNLKPKTNVVMCISRIFEMSLKRAIEMIK